MSDINIKEILSPEFQKNSQGARQGSTGEASFGDMLKQSMNEVHRLQTEANQAITDLSTGQAQNLHSTLVALEKADISFRLMMQVRNKILEAYREVMRMQV
jgi:flagellar hook-basal body complex protein FliE